MLYTVDGRINNDFEILKSEKKNSTSKISWPMRWNLPVMNGVISPISRVISPQLPIYFRPFIRVITTFITGGAHLAEHEHSFVVSWVVNRGFNRIQPIGLYLVMNIGN